MNPELVARVREVMEEQSCSFRQACSIVARHGAAKRRSRARREREREQAKAAYQAQLKSMKLD